MADIQQQPQNGGKLIFDDFYRGILKRVDNGIYHVDPKRTITYWNSAAEKLTGFKACEVVGHQCGENILRHVNEAGRGLCKDGCPLAATLHDGAVHQAYIFLHHRDGYRVPISVSIVPQKNAAGEVVGAVETFSGNSIYMKNMEQLKAADKARYIDAPTGLANRTFMNNSLDARIAEMRRRECSFGMILIQIDQFWQFAETHGAHAADKMLNIVAKTLFHNCCNSDIVGRWDQDKFMTLIPYINQEDLAKQAKTLVALVAHSWLDAEDGRELSVTVSLGATLARTQDTAEVLLARADWLVDIARQKGGHDVATDSDLPQSSPA